MRVGAKRVATVLLLLAIAVELAISDRMLLHSASITHSLQQSASYLSTTMEVYTHIVAALPLVIVFGYLLASKQQLKALYYFTLFYIPIGLATLGKLLLYRGRPWQVRADITGTACDPGMPSGHTIVAFTGFYITYEIFREALQPRPIFKWLLGLFCLSNASLVGLSRIYLGDHSYPQVLMGILISSNCVLHLDLPTFSRLLPSPRPFQSRLALFTACYFSFCLLFLWVNHSYRGRPDFWLHMHKNSACQGSLVIGQAVASPSFCALLGLLLSYPFVSESLSCRPLSRCQRLLRYSLCVTVVILPYGLWTEVTRAVRLSGLEPLDKAAVVLLVQTGLYLTLGISLGWLRGAVLRLCGLVQEQDFLVVGAWVGDQESYGSISIRSALTEDKDLSVSSDWRLVD